MNAITLGRILYVAGSVTDASMAVKPIVMNEWGRKMLDNAQGLSRRFDIHDADWVPRGADGLGAKRPQEYLSNIRRATLLADMPDRLSIYGLMFAPGFYIPTHYHDIDQYLLITSGELRMGTRRLRPGHCAFMPAGNSYNVTIGRAGGSFLEFRSIPAYRTAFSPKDLQIVGPDASTEIEGWIKPPGKKGNTEFIDIESAPLVACDGFGPGDAARGIPEVVASAARYQALHGITGDGYSMISVVFNGAVDVPAHRQDEDKVIFVVGGEMRFDEPMEALRPGAGLFLAAGTALNFCAGPAGVKYLELRKRPSWGTDWSL